MARRDAPACVGRFRGFGESLLAPAANAPLQQIALVPDPAACRKLIRLTAPASPGVYGWLDRNQRLLYVGKSKSLRHRLLSYFTSEPAEPKVERLRATSSRLVWEPTGHELLALLREQELIYRWRPSWNRLGQPERRRPAFIGLARRPAASVAVTFAPSAGQSEICGPIAGVGQLRLAAESLNYSFGLRDCSDRVPMLLSDQRLLIDDLRHAACLRMELGSCLGPCAGACSRQRYAAAVDGARGFLRGSDTRILERLEQQMCAASARLAFETAAVLCQRWQSLQWLARQLARRRSDERDLHGAYPVAPEGRPPSFLWLERGVPIAIGRDPPRPPPIGSSEGEGDGEFESALRIELQLILASWFRKFSDERPRIIHPAGRAARRASA